MNTITMSAIVVTLFLGGPIGPDFTSVGWLSGVLWFFAKLMLFLFAFVWLRATLPRFRYDQLMDLGWKLLIPLSLGWLLVLASYDVAGDRGWNRAAAVIAALAVMAAMAGLLILARRAARQRRELDPQGGFA